MKRKCICCGCITSHHLHYKKTKRNRESADSFSPTASDFGIFYDLLICEECGHVSAETKLKKYFQNTIKPTRPVITLNALLFARNR